MLAERLHQRWLTATPEQHEALGRRLWASLLETPCTALLPNTLFHEIVSRLVTRDVSRALWQALSTEQARADIEALRATGLTLGEVLGREACALLRAGARNPGKPNQELIEQLLDQPILRQALRNMVQRSIQQFVSQLRMPGMGGSPGEAARGSVLGALGRSLASRAEKAAQIGKTFVEGVGGTLYRQVEEQLQPFMSAFMSRSVKQLTESIFDSQQAELAVEARLQVLEILLNSRMEVLLPEPNLRDLKQNLGVLEACSVQIAGFDGWRLALGLQLDRAYASMTEGTLREAMTRLNLALEAPADTYRALGALATQQLRSSLAREFLEEELAAVWSTP